MLILDEPTAGLDVIAREELLEMLRDFIEKDEERSILISSHISSDLESEIANLQKITQSGVFRNRHHALETMKKILKEKQ